MASGVGSAHHSLGIGLLLDELGHGEGAVLPGAMGSEGVETVHEEVKTRDEGAESHGELALRKRRGIELTEEAEAAGVTRHERGYEAAKIPPATGYGVGGADGGGCGWRCWGRDVAGGDVVGGEI